MFVSSTIEDLHDLRDGIRETLDDLGYVPIMSEYGGIGYIPTTTAERSCYYSLVDCQLAVIIVGKRYGSLSENGKSVTQNEFETALERGIPVISLIDQEVLSFKKVYDTSPADNNPTSFPGMDNPAQTFSFIQEIMNAPVNNGISAYANVSDAKLHLKRQLAHLFGNMLKSTFDPLRATVKDAFSEIKTLRYELSGAKQPDQKFLKAIRFMVEDRCSAYRNLIEHSIGSLETAVPILLDSNNFDEFLHKSGWWLEVKRPDQIYSFPTEGSKTMTFNLPLEQQRQKEVTTGYLIIGKDKKIRMTEKEKEHFDWLHQELRKVIYPA